MSGVLKRLTRITKAYVSKGIDSISGEKERTGRQYNDPFEEPGFSTSGYRTGGRGPSDTSGKAGYDSKVPPQVIDDLANFGLQPPSSLKEVKRARNREMKKYHSDRFLNDPEKLKTSKEIMQIYNAAYDRLAAYYQEG